MKVELINFVFNLSVDEKQCNPSNLQIGRFDDWLVDNVVLTFEKSVPSSDFSTLENSENPLSSTAVDYPIPSIPEWTLNFKLTEYGPIIPEATPCEHFWTRHVP